MLRAYLRVLANLKKTLLSRSVNRRMSSKEVSVLLCQNSPQQKPRSELSKAPDNGESGDPASSFIGLHNAISIT